MSIRSDRDEKECLLTERFHKARELDQKWQPKILMPDEDGSIRDIVPLLKPSLLDLAKASTFGYPQGSSFRFHGFFGLQDQDRIIDSIITAALASGSRIRHSRRKQKSSTRLCQIDLFCQLSKIAESEKSKKVHFNENSLQAKCTIIQAEHLPSNRDGKKRTHSVLVKDKDNNDENITPKRRNKVTKIRPDCKSNCCDFKFSIFCSSDHMWYLAFNKS